MSLRSRLIGLVALGFVVSLGIGGALACWNAARSVRTEMDAALVVAAQAARNATGTAAAAGDPSAELGRLIASFDGDRHIEAALLIRSAGAESGAERVEASSVLARPPHEVPAWFIRLLGATPARSLRVPFAAAGVEGAVLLRADPGNEAREIWNEFRDGLLVLGLFSLQAILLIAWSVSRAVLRPLDRFAQALRRIGGGDYTARLEVRGPPELSALAQTFNGVAGRLAEMQAETRRLNERLLTLQEEERLALARDLHDEIGPFLFAVGVDAANIERAAAGNVHEIPGHVRSIRDAIGHMQGQVRALLGRLQPAGLAEFGLADAIDSLIAFWRRRHPDISFRIDCPFRAESFGRLVDATLYRVVQEAVSNAVRHARPRTVEIALSLEAGRDTAPALVLRVSDDGPGLGANPEIGFGLRSMKERVQALGGSLALTSNRTAGAERDGLAVVARLPLPERRSTDDTLALAAGP